MSAFLQRLVAYGKDWTRREPAAVVKIVTWAATWAVAYASQQWFHWADDRQALIIGVVVAWALGWIADWIATRQSVYSPATVDRLTFTTNGTSTVTGRTAFYGGPAGQGPGGGG